MNGFTGAVKAALVSVLLALGGCSDTLEEEPGIGGCWVYDGSQSVLVLLSDSGEVEAIVTDPGGVDFMAAEPQTATLWVTDTDAARLLRVSSSGNKELYISGFASPSSLVIDPDTGGVFLADTEALQVVAIHQEGSILWRAGLAHPPCQLAVAGGDARILLARTVMSNNESGFVGIDPADGTVVFELTLPAGHYDLTADPDADHFWLATGEVLEKRSLADGSLLLSVEGLGNPRVAGAMGDGCWVYDAAGLDLLLVDGLGNLQTEIEDLPGTPELSALGDKVWLSVKEADLVALYDSTGEREVRVSTILDPSPLAGVR